MIFAKIDVTLAGHPKALAAGPAMATWTWGLLYTRSMELDGFVPDVALRGSWSGEEQARRDAVALVALGLWEVRDGGWYVLRYDEKNETKARIDEKRRTDRVRKRPPSTPPPPSGFRLDSDRIPTTTGAGIPDSDSDSGSRSDLREGVQGEVVRRDAPLAEDARAAWATATMTSGPPGKPIEAVWVDFCGHFAGERFPSRERLVGRWQKWVSQQCQYAQTERIRQRERDDAMQRRRDGPPSPPPMTPEESKRFARELARRVVGPRPLAAGAP